MSWRSIMMLWRFSKRNKEKNKKGKFTAQPPTLAFFRLWEIQQELVICHHKNTTFYQNDQIESEILLFIFNALSTGVEQKWSFRETTWKVLLACIIPFGTFYIDYKILRKLQYQANN